MLQKCGRVVGRSLPAVNLRLLGVMEAVGGGRLERGDADTAGRPATEALVLWRGPALADFAHLDIAQPHILLSARPRTLLAGRADAAVRRPAGSLSELEPVADVDRLGDPAGPAGDTTTHHRSPRGRGEA